MKCRKKQKKHELEKNSSNYMNLNNNQQVTLIPSSEHINNEKFKVSYEKEITGGSDN
jgi:hypothetical protein